MNELDAGAALEAIESGGYERSACAARFVPLAVDAARALRPRFASPCRGAVS